jgi:hypothetical protein
VPERDRELARDDGGTQASPILDDFEQACGSLIGEGLNGSESSGTSTSVRAQARMRRGSRPSARPAATSAIKRGFRT